MNVPGGDELSSVQQAVCGGQHDPRADSANNTAKSRMFVPGAGWITFDPTNRSVGGRDLIPVAVARDISQCTPVSGSFFGPSNSFLSMGVTVSVTA